MTKTYEQVGSGYGDVENLRIKNRNISDRTEIKAVLVGLLAARVSLKKRITKFKNRNFKNQDMKQNKAALAPQNNVWFPCDKRKKKVAFMQ